MRNTISSQPLRVTMGALEPNTWPPSMRDLPPSSSGWHARSQPGGANHWSLGTNGYYGMLIEVPTYKYKKNENSEKINTSFQQKPSANTWIKKIIIIFFCLKLSFWHSWILEIINPKKKMKIQKNEHIISTEAVR